MYYYGQLNLERCARKYLNIMRRNLVLMYYANVLRIIVIVVFYYRVNEISNFVQYNIRNTCVGVYCDKRLSIGDPRSNLSLDSIIMSLCSNFDAAVPVDISYSYSECVFWQIVLINAPESQRRSSTHRREEYFNELGRVVSVICKIVEGSGTAFRGKLL